MIETNNIPGFTDKFENMTIQVTEIIVEQFVALLNSDLPKDTAYSNIWQDINSSFLGDELDLRGKIHLFLKNQRDNDMASLLFTISFRVKAEHEKDTVNVFTKTVQYFFGWIKEYVKEHNILGKDGNTFIVPEFPYSKSHFETIF
ncbi:hypothetical protein A3860_26040 [Niastella vici]|uniref:Uncharacterized protein n=1 Tax=Niastella vici TaxID=1703345 RepID=A0A1V9FWW4_9BACT|nr:hypothetical protein [Niastella vici]OQP62778.1 hypothetical protein A3860_26040 [Niastella vici]